MRHAVVLPAEGGLSLSASIAKPFATALGDRLSLSWEERCDAMVSVVAIKPERDVWTLMHDMPYQ